MRAETATRRKQKRKFQLEFILPSLFGLSYRLSLHRLYIETIARTKEFRFPFEKMPMSTSQELKSIALTVSMCAYLNYIWNGEISAVEATVALVLPVFISHSHWISVHGLFIRINLFQLICQKFMDLTMINDRAGEQCARWNAHRNELEQSITKCRKPNPNGNGLCEGIHFS